MSTVVVHVASYPTASVEGAMDRASRRFLVPQLPSGVVLQSLCGRARRTPKGPRHATGGISSRPIDSGSACTHLAPCLCPQVWSLSVGACLHFRGGSSERPHLQDEAQPLRHAAADVRTSAFWPLWWAKVRGVPNPALDSRAYRHTSHAEHSLRHFLSAGSDHSTPHRESPEAAGDRAV